MRIIKPEDERTRVTLKDPKTGKTECFTVYGATPKQLRIHIEAADETRRNEKKQPQLV
jgi:hypothetical protein